MKAGFGLCTLALTLPLFAQTAAPPDDPWLSGSIDVGYRWQTGVGGSVATYRSVVDLGSGPKLLGADFTILDPKRRFFDRIDVRAYDWGGDPYSTVHVNVKKSALYTLNADYRNLAYFDDVPSFADPLLETGVTLNERAYDIRQRIASFQLDLFPGNWLKPYLSYDRNSNSGSGVTALVAEGNEYAIPQRIRNESNNYRAGVHLELPRFHVTLELGGITYKDDESEYVAPGSTNYGNNPVALLGQTLDLTSVLQAYGVSGNSIYTKGLLTSSPFPWLDVYGQFLYSKPDTSVTYQQTDSGTLAILSQALFFTNQQSIISAESNLPHTSGSIGFEARPFLWMRIVQSWLTDRLHNDGSSFLQQTFSQSAASQQNNLFLTTGLVTNYNQEETEVFVDPRRNLTLHGGFRYVWGDASDEVFPLQGLVSADSGKLSRKVAIGGISYRPFQALSLSANVEGASSNDTYFSTSLRDYQKVRASARYRAPHSLVLSADITYLNNSNPSAGSNYSFTAHQASLSILWTPEGGKRLDFEGSYTRSTVHSNATYFDPVYLIADQSIYRDNAHIATALLGLNLPKLPAGAARISAGGSLVASSGSRPTRFYQPLVKLSVPIHKGVSWNSEWRYYGFGEDFYQFEGFRTNLVTTGIRLSR